MSLPTRGWEEKMCSFCRFSLQNSFAKLKVRAVMSKRMHKRSHAWPRGKLIFAVSLFFYLYICRSRQPTALDLFRVNWLRSYNKHANKTLKGGGAGSTSRLDSSLFEEGWEGEGFKKSPWLLPDIRRIGICRSEEQGFCAVLVWARQFTD